MHRIHLALVRLLAPLLSFTSEEAWQHTRKPVTSPASVHLDYFPVPEELTDGLPQGSTERLAAWDRLIEIRGIVLKSLDEAREQKLIGAPLEAAVTIQAAGETYDLLNAYLTHLPALFIVSQVELTRGSEETVSVAVDRARGDKCERCWKYTLDVGQDEAFPTICHACTLAVKEYVAGD